MHCTALSASLPPSRASETSCSPLMKPWRARCIQFNNVIFHWLITINIYVTKICAVFRVKCEEWQVGCHRLYTGVIFTLTSRNVTWFYYCNFDSVCVRACVSVCACAGGVRFSNSNRIIPGDYQYYFCLKCPFLIYIYILVLSND